MNKSPINYLIAIALGGLLWVVTAVFYGGSFSESLTLAVSTPEDFLANFRTMLGIAAGIGILFTIFWFYYGSLDKTAGELDRAKKKWWIYFILAMVACAGVLSTLIFKNLPEGIATGDWIIVFALVSVHTWFFFWICTFLMSPRNVKNIPLFR